VLFCYSRNNQLAIVFKRNKAFIKKYLKDVETPITDRALDDFGNSSELDMTEYLNGINSYFDGLSPKSSKDFKGFEGGQKESIRMINLNLIKAEELINKYYSEANQFLSLNKAFESDLQRSNPFSEATYPESKKAWDAALSETKGLLQVYSQKIEQDYLEIDVRKGQ
jgi:hypothetical protein